jgi:thiol-disulfide isomerase/thioredoxin
VIAAAAAAAALVAVGVVVARGGSGTAVAMPVYSASKGRIEFSGDDPVTGREVDLAAYQGKAVVVNIWASWCTGCNAEAPDLRRLAQLHPEAQLVGVDYQDTRGEAKSFYRRWGLSHPSVFDPHGEIAAKLGLQGLPTTLFLDRDHRLVSRIVGASNLSGFEDGLRKATRGG